MFTKHLKSSTLVQRAGVLGLAAILSITAIGCAKKKPAAASQSSATELYARGLKAYEAGNRTAATADFESAVAAGPKLIMAREKLGDAYKDAGQLEKALSQYQVLVELDPYGPASWRRLGIAEHLLGRLPQASESYSKAIKLDANDYESHMNLGLVKMAEGKGAEAVVEGKKSTELAPTQPDVWTNYGATLDATGDMPGAESAYRRSLQLKPEQPAVQMNLANNLITQKKGEEAVNLMRQVVKMEDSAMARRRLGDALLLDKKNDEAEAEYRTALKLDPAYYPALNSIGWAKIDEFKGTQDDAKRMQAIEAWNQSLKMNTNQPAIDAAIKANTK